MKIGFWYSKYEPHLPMPVAGPPGAGSAAAELFKRLERHPNTYTRYYKGSSTCRICGERNGSGEFTLAVSKESIHIWPEGLRHYLEVHDVLLSEEVCQALRKYV